MEKEKSPLLSQRALICQVAWGLLTLVAFKLLHVGNQRIHTLFRHGVVAVSQLKGFDPLLLIN